MTRQSWIEASGPLPIQRQCVLAGVARSGVYARPQPKEVADSDLRISALIDQEYTWRWKVKLSVGAIISLCG